MGVVHYVLGLAFDRRRKLVVLIRKARPEWQAGMLNGVGGKVKVGESPEQAMIREFDEETGVITLPGDWQPFARLHGAYFDMTVFRLESDVVVGQVRTMTDEEIVVSALDLNVLREAGVSNLSWLVGCALDSDQPRLRLDVCYQQL
ncbi:NUDIX domain-containing protein [Cupriavidus sp. TMH.W2]|uniref:NUDIX domain-containing protein n=1 Tax=Cupriavidus sp. TMH.W2 TaxID=3434465 RepID=UPI003D7788E6